MGEPKGVTDRRMGTLWELVEASPEEIAKACMEGPPKAKWDYLNKGKKASAGQE